MRLRSSPPVTLSNIIRNKPTRHCPRLAALFLALLAACQPSPDELWRKAEAAGAAGDYAEAAIHLKNLLRQRPDDAQARVALGVAALALGDPVSAEKELRRAITLGVPPASVRLALAEAMIDQAHFADALAELTAEESGPKDSRALMLRGRAHEGLGQVAEADKAYREASAAAPGEAEPLVALTSLALADGRTTDADEWLDQALAINPSDIPALVLRGRRLVETKGPAQAEAHLRDALARASNASQRLQVLGALTEVQLMQEDLKGAAASVAEIEDIAPQEISTRYLRARLQAQSGDYGSAILGLQRIMNDAPAFTPAERLLGTVHYLNGNLEQAAVHIGRVIGEGRSDPFLSRILAEIRLQQSRPDQALQTLLPMIRQGPGAAFEQGMLALAGQASLRLGNSESALAFFRRGAEQYPDDERFRLGEISARLASGDVGTARTMLEGMRASSSNTVAVDYLSVMTYLVERDLPRAENLATRLARENTGAAWAHMLLATVNVVAGRGVAARGEFEKVLEIDPASKEALINLARLDYQDGDRRSAENRLLRVIEAHPEDYRPRLLLAEAQLNAHRFNEALEQGRQVLRLAPDSTPALDLVGRAAAAAGRWDEARESFARITTLDPGNSRAWLSLARATVDAGQRGALPESLSKAMELAPRDAAVLVTTGDLLMEFRQPEEAARYFERAFRAGPGGEVAIRHCRALLATNSESSCPLLAAWLEKNPQDVPTRIFRATLLQARGRLQDATQEYESILGVDPRQTAALNNLAWIYFEAGDERALALAERALQAQPESGPAMDTLGWIQLRRGDRRRGLELITSAAKLLPEDPNIQYHLAFALVENGDVERARRTLEATLESSPRFFSRADAEQLLRRIAAAGGGADG